MSYYAEELAKMKPGDPHPPFNTGPYDNPLVWNNWDPFMAERGHQRRPIQFDRNFMELYDIKPIFRGSCVNRYLPLKNCVDFTKPFQSLGNNVCFEYFEAYLACITKEFYRCELMKRKFIEFTKDYTDYDKNYFPFPGGYGMRQGIRDWWWPMVYEMRVLGMDDKDPRNTLMNREPNRALMRAEFSPTNWERGQMTSSYGHKMIDDELIAKELPSFPLPESKRPQ